MQNNWYIPTGKRLFDFTFALIGLILISPLLIIISLIIKLSSKGPVIFAHERIGQHEKPFKCLKFRTMVINAASLGPAVTSKNDPRITQIGRMLRNTKLDELPQLINVLIGEMSFVGPRPEVSKYVQAAYPDYKQILQIKPGITDYAAIEFRHEEEILAGEQDKETAYLTKVLPQKIQLYYKYLQTISLKTDLKLIWLTLKRI